MKHTTGIAVLWNMLNKKCNKDDIDAAMAKKRLMSERHSNCPGCKAVTTKIRNSRRDKTVSVIAGSITLKK